MLKCSNADTQIKMHTTYHVQKVRSNALVLGRVLNNIRRLGVEGGAVTGGVTHVHPLRVVQCFAGSSKQHQRIGIPSSIAIDIHTYIQTYRQM